VQCLHRIQRIRSYYRELSPRAARFFPASSATGASGLFQVMAISPRARFQFLFTVAAMVAAINSIVAGVAIALLLHGVVDLAASAAIAVGVAVALVAMTVLMFDERRRYQRMHAAEAMFDEAVNARSAWADAGGPR
jgi:hypothetical protein